MFAHPIASVPIHDIELEGSGAEEGEDVTTDLPPSGERKMAVPPSQVRRRFSLDGAFKAIGALKSTLTSANKEGGGTPGSQGTSGSDSDAASGDTQGGAVPAEGGGSYPPIRTLKGWFNTATTSTKPPQEIIVEVVRVLEAHNIPYERNGYIVSAWQNGADGRKILRMEFEVCHIPRLSLYGLHLKRVLGDVWLYKKTCTDLVSQMKL